MNKETLKSFIFLTTCSLGFLYLLENPAPAKTVQEAIEENNRRINEQNQRTTQAMQDMLNRQQKSIDSALKGVEDGKRIQESMGITSTNVSNRIDHSINSNSGTYNIPARSNGIKRVPTTTPDRCFSEFLWALRGATSSAAIKNYLDVKDDSYTVESLRKTFANVLKIENCAVNGSDAVLNVQTKGKPGRINVKMKSDGAYWRIVGL